jgi:hypothetical protein
MCKAELGRYYGLLLKKKHIPKMGCKREEEKYGST